ncbi:MAG TPA: helix-turn-helix transcriptional regulator [Solirubrobacteraceae bacterium]|nr:helix-turn-helix transcriptional regulator [Solirubrobacteraceae bacterium]HTZ88304.1 helix-turn-helix transcriptional regulator [Solirubrobacteraceae bacterium]
MELPERLVAARRGAGLTQSELAERAGVHLTQLNRYEAGTSEPTLRVVRRLCVTLGLSADELVFGEQSAADDDGELGRAFEAARGLDAQSRAALVLLVSGLVALDNAKRRVRGARRPR